MKDLETLQPAAGDNDLLPVVNAQDRQIGVKPRRMVHLQQLRHRAVHVIVVDGEGSVWLQHRAMAKDTYAGWWDLSATGHVDPGEDYAAAARRELMEELGIDADPFFIDKLDAIEPRGWEFHGIYGLTWHGSIANFNRDEIDALRKFTIGEIEESLASPDPLWRLTHGVRDAVPYLKQLMKSGAARGLVSG